MKNREYTIYLLHKKHSDFYKIGLTDNINRRLLQIKEQHYSSEIDLVGRFIFKDRISITEKERLLHVILKNKRVQGEWFIFTDSEIRLIYDFINVFFNAEYSCKGDYLREPIESKVFIPNWNNKPYSFNL